MELSMPQLNNNETMRTWVMTYSLTVSHLVSQTSLQCFLFDIQIFVAASVGQLFDDSRVADIYVAEYANGTRSI
jgi:hypothetical protein